MIWPVHKLITPVGLVQQLRHVVSALNLAIILVVLWLRGLALHYLRVRV